MSGLEHSRVAAVVDRLKVKDKQYESAMSYIAHVAASDDVAIQEARLEELETLTESKRRLPILIWALCVIAFTLLTLGIFQLEQNRQYLSSYGVASTSFEPAQMRKASEKYSAEERMVLDGDIQYNGHLDRIYHRWQADRENSIYYIDYCQTYEQTTYTYPTDMIEVGASIDPHNAWYYLASLSTMNLRDDNVLKRIRNGSNYADPAAPACRLEVWEVNNRTEVDKAYEYLKQSYAKKT